ncbi:MAG: dipeptidase [Acidobacteriota bacterium]
MNRRHTLLAAALVAASGVACGDAASDHAADAATDELASHADRLAHEIAIVDTHIDVPYRLQEKMEDISRRTESGDFDYPRARKGGLDAAFMSIYIPASYQETGGAGDLADDLIDMVEGFERDHPDKFGIARSPADVRTLRKEGRVALPMGMENGAPIETLAALAHFQQRGIRYITLTHAENNQICDSSYADGETWHGLSPFGRQVVAEMNRLGIMIDISHVSDKTFDAVISLSQAPPIASHSSCRAFTPGWQRNMDDRMIRDLAAKGGVIQINFGSAFLRADAQEQSTVYHDALDAFLADNDLERTDPRAVDWETAYWRDHARIYADVSDVADHIEHVIELVGVDHVGLGSDFDGVGDSLPTSLKDVSAYPNLIRELLRRGHTDDEIARICGGNLLRVWEKVEAVARDLQAAGS